MSASPKGWHSRGFLPHFDSPERVQHIVFRTRDSLPASVLAAMPEDARERRKALDAWLDRGVGAAVLRLPAAAQIVQNALLHFDGDRYRLLAWCIMPNHVHVVCETTGGHSIGSIIRSWKAFTGAAINRVNAVAGPVWARDYFDRYARSEDDIGRMVGYVEQNPVTAGLVGKAEDWLWSSAARRVQERA